MTTIVRTYKARAGGGISNKDARIVGSFLEKKIGPDASCSAGQFVALARPERSPLHRLLNWDDQNAATEYRLWQARSIMNHLVVIVSNGEHRETRAYQNVVIYNEDGAERTYVPAHVVWQSAELSVQVLDQAKRYLLTFTERFREYEQLSGAIEHVVQALEELDEAA